MPVTPGKVSWLTSRTVLYVLEGTEANAQVFLSIGSAFRAGKERAAEGEEELYITSFQGPCDELDEARGTYCFTWDPTFTDPSGSHWRKEKLTL